MSHLSALLVVCSAIALIGSVLPPVEAFRWLSANAPPATNADALALLTEYEGKADQDVKEATTLIDTTVNEGTQQVQQLYATFGSQLQQTIGHATPSNIWNVVAARQLQSYEIPFYLEHVNGAVKEASDNIKTVATKFNAEVHRQFDLGKSDVDLTASPAVIGQQVAKLTDQVKAGVQKAIQQAQSEVEQYFIKASRIVQAYISLIESRVRSVFPGAVAQQVSTDIQNTKKLVDGVEDSVVVNVEQALLQINNIFLRLAPFLDALNQLE